MARASTLVPLLVALTACRDAAAPAPALPVSLVQLTPSAVQLEEGDTIHFRAVPRDSLGAIVARTKARWSSSQPAVASIDSLGLVIAHSVGQVEIHAQVGNLIGRATATVTSRRFVRFTQVTTGTEHTCARTETGEVYCWGANRFAQLASATPQSTSSPLLVHIEESVVAVAAGYRHNCAASTGVWCWGANNAGQAGDWRNGDKVFTRPVHLLVDVSAGVATPVH